MGTSEKQRIRYIGDNMAKKAREQSSNSKRDNSDTLMTQSVPSGILGLDQILGGGYPRGRVTVIRGASGTGKSIFALLYAMEKSKDDGAVVFATFDESPDTLRNYLTTWSAKTNVQFLDFRPDPEIMTIGGQMELGGMLVRIEHALSQSGANRLVLDAFDTLFGAFENKAQVRLDLFRIFDWCRKRGVSVVATTGEENDYRASTGIMDYAADCTILLDQRVDSGLMTRLLRVMKCRGRAHGTNEYPFLIDEHGVSVLPVTGTAMSERASEEKMSTGLKDLDDMLGGGIWKGNTVMISGQSGTGKSLLALSMAAAACRTGMKVLHLSFEESPQQIVRDAGSAGIRLASQVKSKKLRLISRRSVEYGIEQHIILKLREVDTHEPDVVVFDPISALSDLGDSRTFKNMAIRLCHELKARGITTILTELLPDDAGSLSKLNVSSLVDTWIRIGRIERSGEMRRKIQVQKSRGAATSREIRELHITDNGIVIGESINAKDFLGGSST